MKQDWIASMSGTMIWVVIGLCCAGVVVESMQRSKEERAEEADREMELHAKLLTVPGKVILRVERTGIGDKVCITFTDGTNLTISSRSNHSASHWLEMK